MSAHCPILVVVIPLLCAFFISGVGWINKRLCFPAALVGLTLSAGLSVVLLLQVLDSGPLQYKLGGWDPPWGIAYEVDRLNGLVLAVVSVLALVNLIATHRSIQEELPDRVGAVYTLYVLFVTGLAGIVITGDLFNLYVLLEVASLTSYALIALGKDRAPLSSLNYVFMGTIGACFYLLGVGYLYIMTGSLNMDHIASLLPPLYDSSAILAAFIFCMVGVWIKMAFFPLHIWLPNAYTYAPSAVSSLIAPLMTKVMAYVMIRLVVSVFSTQFAFAMVGLTNPVVWLSSLAIIMGAFFALTQTNLKKMFTYIIVSEIGYMVGGAWLGNRAGMTGAVLHIMNDAMMTLCLFLAAGNIFYRSRGLDWRHLQGLFKKMPFTMGAFVAGGLSVIGVPPTCGFFSKWYLLSGAVQAGHYGFMVALLASSLINVVLFFRVIEMGYYGRADPSVKEAPADMVTPLLIVSAGLVAVGLYTGPIVTHVIQPFLPPGLG